MKNHLLPKLNKSYSQTYLFIYYHKKTNPQILLKVNTHLTPQFKSLDLFLKGYGYKIDQKSIFFCCVMNLSKLLVCLEIFCILMFDQPLLKFLNLFY